MAWVLEFDIKGLFDNVDHELMMQVVRKHTDSKWMILYIERFLKADMVMLDGTVCKRTSGTPQGGVISPVLANLYMHYAFDRWMVTRNPGNPWARYADDGVVHCQTKAEAEALLNRLKDRLSTCKLEVHPEKTRIVYCRSYKNKERHENESFDFLGYTFRCREARNDSGKFFSAFSPAVSQSAIQSFKEKMKDCRRRGRLIKPEELAAMMNPIIRGWTNYFMKFCPSEARKKALDYLNYLIVRWARKRYKRLRGSFGKAYRWLVMLAKARPNLFWHWQMGIRPTMR